MTRNISVLMRDDIIVSTIRNRIIDLLFFRDRRYISFWPDFIPIEQKSIGMIYKRRHLFRVKDLEYMIVPHNGEHSNKLSVYLDGKQCGVIGMDVYLTNGVFATIILSEDVDLMHICTVITGLFLYYKQNTFQEFSGYIGVEYREYNPRWG